LALALYKLQKESGFPQFDALVPISQSIQHLPEWKFFIIDSNCIFHSATNCSPVKKLIGNHFLMSVFFTLLEEGGLP